MQLLGLNLSFAAAQLHDLLMRVLNTLYWELEIRLVLNCNHDIIIWSCQPYDGTCINFETQYIFVPLATSSTYEFAIEHDLLDTNNVLIIIPAFSDLNPVSGQIENLTRTNCEKNVKSIELFTPNLRYFFSPAA